MGYSLDPEAYDPRYGALYSMALDPGADIFIPCQDESAARAVRYRLYGYRHAMNRAGKAIPGWKLVSLRVYQEGRGWGVSLRRIISGTAGDPIGEITGIPAIPTAPEIPTFVQENEALVREEGGLIIVLSNS